MLARIIGRTPRGAAPLPQAVATGGTAADVVALHVAHALDRAGARWRRVPGGGFAPAPAPRQAARTITVWVPIDPGDMPTAIRPATAVRLASQLHARAVRVAQDGQFVRVEVPRGGPWSPVPLPRTGTAIARAADGRWAGLTLDDASPHALVAGASGSGKTTACVALALTESRRGHVVVLNPKREMGYAPLGALLHTVAVEADEIDAALAWVGARIGTTGRGRVVVVVDEWTELTPAAQVACERIAAVGRSADVHLVIGTQYPRADVVSTVTRTNAGAVLAGRLEPSASRVVLGTADASALLGRGDMLLGARDARGVTRVQVCQVTDADWTSAGWGRLDDAAEASSSSVAPPSPPHPSQAPTPTPPEWIDAIVGEWRARGHQWPGVWWIRERFEIGANRAARVQAEAMALDMGDPGNPGDPGGSGGRVVGLIGPAGGTAGTGGTAGMGGSGGEA